MSMVKRVGTWRISGIRGCRGETATGKVRLLGTNVRRKVEGGGGMGYIYTVRLHEGCYRSHLRDTVPLQRGTLELFAAISFATTSVRFTYL